MTRRRAPLPPHMLAASARMREVAAARRGVYADAGAAHAGADPAHHVECAALLAALAAPAVVSHLSAARLLGLPLPPGAPPAHAVVTRRRPGPGNDPLGGEVHVLGYDDAEVRDVGGVPVLAGVRVVLDCADVLAPDSALAVADAALGRRLTTARDLAAAVRARRVRSEVLDRIVERADPLAESWFESVSRWWLAEAGLPRPRLQVPFADRHGRVRARVDMLLDGVVGEADGAGKYDAPGALFAEKQREDWLRHTHRLEVVRWVPAEMRAPAGRSEVVARFVHAGARTR